MSDFSRMRKEVRPCLYRIDNLATGEFYVGSAWQPFQRYYDHFKNLKKKRHKNHFLQKSFDEHGIGAFQFQIIRSWPAEELDRKTLFRLEQQYINTLNPHFNIKRTVSGFIMNDEIKKKLADARSQEWTVVDPQGNETPIKNLRRFCKDNGLCKKQMLDVANGKSSHHRGWKCRRKADSQQQYKRRIGKEYDIIFPDGSKHRIRDLAKFCREHDLSYHCMVWKKYSKGYHCSNSIK